MQQQTTFNFDTGKPNSDEQSITCLNKEYDSAEHRRVEFSRALGEFLAGASGKSGWPRGPEGSILSLSDPPYYTVCPNPFLAEFAAENDRPIDDGYRREPFAIDVSVGKSDQLYKAHSYHTKVPHLAIVPSILHYTRPGDVVLDGFCGSGMTGVACQWCGSAPFEYKQTLEAEWRNDGHTSPEWGPRKAILTDIGVAATFIAANNNIPFDMERFVTEAERILGEVESECGWMYETVHDPETGTKGAVNYVVWSQVFSCPECAAEVNFFENALDRETNKVHKKFFCPNCDCGLTKKSLERLFETAVDPITGIPWERIKLVPSLINYTVGSKTVEKFPDSHDHDILQKIEKLSFPECIPTDPFPINEMYHGSRLAPKGFTHVHHLFFPRQAYTIAAFWSRARAVTDTRIRNMLLFWLDSQLTNLSLQNRYRPHVSFPYNPLSGVYYVSSLISEADPFRAYRNKLKRITSAFSGEITSQGDVFVGTGDCADLRLPDSSVDYIFTDPPFGENLFYADLNFPIEAWHGIFTDNCREAIVDRAKNKDTLEYQNLIRACFEEYFRVLKPGRWMTVVFSNSKNHIWRAIQEAIGTAGFVIADVRTLDKKQGSYRQVTSSAVKQDLVISAYKPTAELAEKFSLDTADESTAWAFVAEHLKNVPVFVGRSGEEAEPVVERTPQMLHDRMVAFFVQRRMSIPISSPDFFAGLDERYAKRDGMYFLPDQVAEYDRKRMTVKELRELDLFVSDEASAIQWLRQQLNSKPQSFQDLQPKFMPQVQTWPKHEKDVDLKELLEQSFLRYDGKGEVPSQIANYLSKNYREFRGVSRESSALKEKAKDRWYVPDPRKTGDLEKLRFKTLIKEFEEYKNSKDRKIKLFRTEAVRAGFKDCYEKKDYDTIIKIWQKLPSKIAQEDEALVMYYDVASMRAGD